MLCKKCLEDVYPDCVLSNGVCVFCHYNTKTWESNGEIVYKKQAIIDSYNFFQNYTQYYKKALKIFQDAYEELPKGNVKERLISGNKYYYLQKRIGSKIKHCYLGKEKPKELIAKIKKRIKLKNKILEIRRILFIIREARRPSANFNRYDILERDKFTCQYCGRKAPDVILVVDHIIPVSKGGLNDVSNLATACSECNSQKSNKLTLKE